MPNVRVRRLPNDFHRDHFQWHEIVMVVARQRSQSLTRQDEYHIELPSHHRTATAEAHARTLRLFKPPRWNLNNGLVLVSRPNRGGTRVSTGRRHSSCGAGHKFWKRRPTLPSYLHLPTKNKALSSCSGKPRRRGSGWGLVSVPLCVPLLCLTCKDVLFEAFDCSSVPCNAFCHRP